MRISETRRADVLIEYVDENGHHYLDGDTWRIEPLTADEEATVAAEDAAAAANAPILTIRADLADALALADLYPAPTPEETAIIDAQVNAALAGFRALSNPPADVVALAAAVVSWRTEV